MIGRTLSHYKVLEELSRGGMGVIYRAIDLNLDREVALKLLLPELVADLERRRRFLQEAKAAAALEHPHIAAVHEVDEAEGITFIAMELIRGESLRDIPPGHLSLARSLRLSVEIAEGLAKAHEKGVAHRDLKPANIMVTEDGHAKIIDFGVAKLIEPLGGDTEEAETRVQETAWGRLVGTVGYMSPEQARGRRVDHRTDTFSFGIVLYEMLAGAPPFSGPSDPETLNAIINLAAPPLNLPGETDASRELQRIAHKCLAKDPSDRYQTMKDLAVDLRAVLRAIESGIAVPGMRRPKGKTGQRWVQASAVLLAVASIAGYTMYRLDREADRRPTSGRLRIAVLPFENLGRPEDEYFAAGVTEEITSRLAVVSGLAVISRNSVAQYKDTHKTAQQIGRELDVEYILEGTVRWPPARDGMGRVRVTPQLIRTTDDTHVWADAYDRRIDEIFAVQSDIAERVTRQLDVALLAPEREAMRARPTTNLEAYQAYLQGLHHLHGPDSSLETAARLAIQMLELAVEMDSGFALAYARLAEANSQYYHFGFDRSSERLQKAKSAAGRALELEPGLPEARLALGSYHYYGHKDYTSALRELAVAEKGLPNNREILALTSYILRRQGKPQESLAKLEEAIRLDPASAELFFNQGLTYTWLRHYENAARYYDMSISAAPKQANAYLHKAWNNWLWGKITDARLVLDAAPEKHDPQFVWSRVLQEIYQRRYREALERLAASTEEAYVTQNRFVPRSLARARVQALLGESQLASAAYDEARRFLEKALQEQPEDYRMVSALGIAYAGLGRKADAIRQGKRAVELYPVSLDALFSPSRIEDLALIYALVGEPDAALEEIARLLSMPSLFSAAMLKLDPAWDSLRQHPRYYKILEQHH